jgi:hypothetical protein
VSVSAAEQGVAEDPVKLTVTGISKSFGGVQAAKDISLTVLEGMIFAEVFLRTSWRNRWVGGLRTETSLLRWHHPCVLYMGVRMPREAGKDCSYNPCLPPAIHGGQMPGAACSNPSTCRPASTLTTLGLTSTTTPTPDASANTLPQPQFGPLF